MMISFRPFSVHTHVGAIASLSAALLVAACDDNLDLGNAGAAVGSGGSAGAGGEAAGKSGAGGGSAGAAGAGQAGGGTAGKGGGGGTGASGEGGAAGKAGSGAGGSDAGAGGSDGGAGGGDAGAGGSEGGASGSDAGAGGSDAGAGGSEAGAGGSDAGAGGSDAGAGGTGAGAAGSGAGGGGIGGGGGVAGSAGGEAGMGGVAGAPGGAGGVAGAPGGSGGAAGASAGSGGTAGSSAGSGGGAGASGGSAGKGGSGGAPSCTGTKVTALCSAPLAPIETPCWTPFTLAKTERTSCFTEANDPGPFAYTGDVARVSLSQTSRVVVWRTHSNSDGSGSVFGIANDDCTAGGLVCVDFAKYGDIATAELPPGNYQIQSRAEPSGARYPKIIVEPPAPPATNTTCAAASTLVPNSIAPSFSLQPRVVEGQPRHYAFKEIAASTRKILLKSSMNIGKATVRVRETCQGAVVAEGTVGYVLALADGVVAVQVSTQALTDYQLEVIAPDGLQYAIAVK